MQKGRFREMNEKTSDHKYCCDDLKHHIEHKCSQHPQDECPDKILNQYASGIGIPVHDGSYISISYCPFCGAKL
jgi:hypothetical protein